jgi:hypothetical protein
VDIFLALIMIAAGVTGAQFGTRASGLFKGEQLRGLLALLVLLVFGKMIYSLIATPSFLYSVEMIK